MGVFNALEFDGINSLDYGVYITGEAVFNSPQRSVEAVTVPGRNGDVLLDLGRYENIEVTYHAGVFGADQSEFATKIRTFRNLLASRVGYKRITDTYNPNEYRMGTFIASVDVTPTSMDRHGEFDIVFNCKPQRFLTSGETAITVADGDTVTNPTLFDAQPLLAIEGYGTIGFNGYEVEIENATMGNVTLIEPYTIYSTVLGTTSPYVTSIGFDGNIVESGDTVIMKGRTITVGSTVYYGACYAQALFAFAETTYALDIMNRTFSQSNVNYSDGSLELIEPVQQQEVSIRMSCTQAAFTIGTASTYSASCTMTVPIVYKSNSSPTGKSAQLSANLTLDYDGDHTITITYERTVVSDPLNIFIGTVTGSHLKSNLNLKQATAESSVTIMGHPTYIDCELGEAYKIENGEFISLNEYIDLGSDLPTLAPGNNEFTFDNTMTDVKIMPKWWIL